VFVTIWKQEIGTKAAREILVKLTTGGDGVMSWGAGVGWIERGGG